MQNKQNAGRKTIEGRKSLNFRDSIPHLSYVTWAQTSPMPNSTVIGPDISHIYPRDQLTDRVKDTLHSSSVVMIIIINDARESNFLFQQLSVALQRGNAVSFQNTFTTS